MTLEQAYEESIDSGRFSTNREAFEAGYEAAAQRCVELAERGSADDQMTWEFLAELRKEFGL
jgi:hypothetical protein